MNLSIRYGLPFVTAVLDSIIGLDFLQAVRAMIDLGELTIS
jgi:hypothetical protein